MAKTALTTAVSEGKASQENAPEARHLPEFHPAAPAPAPESAPPQPPYQEESTLSIKEAAFRLHKSDRTIRRWLAIGRLRGWQPGGRKCWVMVEEASVTEALICRIGSPDF